MSDGLKNTPSLQSKILKIPAMPGGSAGADEARRRSGRFQNASTARRRARADTRITSNYRIPPAGLEPAISCVKGRRPNR